MDPLSVTASIIGILAAGAKVIEVLGPIPSALSGARLRLNAISTEVSNCMTTLSALQTLFINIDSISSQRKDLIHLDHLITTFTDGVLLFSELETLVFRVCPGEGSTTWRLRLLNHEKDLCSLLERLQWFKSSTSLLLNILQCDSTVDALRHQRALFSTVDDILKNNDDLMSRLARVEHYLLGSRALDHSRPASTVGAARENLAGLVGAQSDQRISLLMSTLSLQTFSFEHDLEASRPYRNVTRDTVDYSVRSSVVDSHAWSALSDTSLSKISVIGVIRLPIVSSDIRNSYHYAFREPNESSRKTQQRTTLTARTAGWARYFYPESLSPSQDKSWPTAAEAEISEGVSLIKTTNSQLAGRQGSSKEHAIPTIIVSSDERFPQFATKMFSSPSCLVPVQQIVVVGGAGTGKSDFRIEFVRPHYGDEYDPTVEDSYQKTCMIDDEIARLEILDTAGQEEYSALREQYMRTGDGFLLVFSVTSQESFEEIVTFMQQIQQVKGKAYFPILVVGNHCTQESEREVRHKQGRNLAETYGYEYIEADAKKGVNVQEAFFEIVREIRQYDKFKLWMAQQALENGQEFEAARNATRVHAGTARRAHERTVWQRNRRGPSMGKINEDS